MKIFNDNGLFWRVPDWYKKLQNQTVMESFLFRASCAYMNVTQIHNLSSRCVQEFQRFEKSLSLKNDRIAFWSPLLSRLFNEFSPALTNMRIMQDLILTLAGQGQSPRISVPRSLSDAMKKDILKGMNQEVWEILSSYWQRSGYRLKDYRDLDQHFYEVARHSFIQVRPETKLLMFLPDNPEEKAPSRLTYRNEVDAISFFRDAFLNLHKTVDDIAKALGYGKNPFDQAVIFPKGLFAAGEPDSTIVLVLHDPNQGFEFRKSVEGNLVPRRLPKPEE